MAELWGDIIRHFTIAFIAIIAFSLLFIWVKGGLFPSSIFNPTQIKQGFGAPVVFLGRTNNTRVYMMTTFDKTKVLDGLGSLQVEYTTSKQKNVGINTTAYSFDRLSNITFSARADRPGNLVVKFRDKNGEYEFKKTVELTTTWQTYKLTPGDLIEGTNVSFHDVFGRIEPYIEFSIPASETQMSGRFWLDNLIINSFDI